jgi:energy-coupling factor transport system permease protein
LTLWHFICIIWCFRALALYWGLILERPFLHGLDARTKLGAAAVLIAGLLLADKPVALALYAVLIALAAVLARFPLRLAAAVTLALWPILVITLLVHGFVGPPAGETLMSYAGLCLTTTGLAQGGIFAARLVLFVFISRIVLHVGSGEEYARALGRLLSPLRRLRLPVGEVQLILGVAFRLIPILEREASRLALAKRARGEARNWVGKMRQLPAILVPLFVGAFRHADGLAIAMEARGFAVGVPRSSYIEAHFRWLDALVLALVTGIAAVAITVS